METPLRIEKGDVHRIAVANDTVSSAVVWNVYDNSQQTLNTSLTAGTELILGPYINITTFRIEVVGDVTVGRIGDDFSVAVPISDYITGTGVTRRISEQPTGDLDGVNTIFTISHSPTDGLLEFYLNGILQTEGSDYTFTGVTIAVLVVPVSADVMNAIYNY